MLFTTSWDDGYKLDLAVADMLESYGATGTFYVCPQVQYDQPMLSNEEIAQLNQQHEVGAHTIKHPKLAKCEPAIAQQEIEESKAWIESITGNECTMFCYPYGNENLAVRNMVEKAGFKGARTTEMLQFDSSGDRFGLPTSQQVYPFPWRKRFVYWWHYADIAARFRVQHAKLRKCGVPLTAQWSWLSMAKRLFSEAVEREEPFFHIWGHSQELERYGQWNDLEELLAFIQGHGDIIEHVTNGTLVQKIYNL